MEGYLSQDKQSIYLPLPSWAVFMVVNYTIPSFYELIFVSPVCYAAPVYAGYLDLTISGDFVAFFLVNTE